MIQNLNPNDFRFRSISREEWEWLEREALALPFGSQDRREWLTFLATAYPSWDCLAHDTRNTPTLRGTGNPVSEALADEYDAYHAALGNDRHAV
jgi:hypothetical protein